MANKHKKNVQPQWYSHTQKKKKKPNPATMRLSPSLNWKRLKRGMTPSVGEGQEKWIGKHH